MSVFVEGLLAGKHAFVAGGTSGINLGIARRLVQAGARASLLGRNAERGQKAVQALKEAGGEAAYTQGDVREYAAMERALSEAVERFGPLDILVNGAAGNFPAPVLGMSSNGFRAVVDIDLVGTFNGCRAGFPVSAAAGRRGGECLRAAGLRPGAPASPRLRSEGRGGHAHPRPGHGVGRGRGAGECHYARAHCGHRGHGASGHQARRRRRASRRRCPWGGWGRWRTWPRRCFFCAVPRRPSSPGRCWCVTGAGPWAGSVTWCRAVEEQPTGQSRGFCFLALRGAERQSPAPLHAPWPPRAVSPAGPDRGRGDGAHCDGGAPGAGDVEGP